MKTMYIACTFFLSLSISASLFSKPSHHFVTVINNTNHDIILSEFEQNIKKTKHTISSRSQRKCNFLRTTDYVEATVKLGSSVSVYYNVGTPITSRTQMITINQNPTLRIRAQ